MGPENWDVVYPQCSHKIKVQYISVSKSRLCNILEWYGESIMKIDDHRMTNLAPDTIWHSVSPIHTFVTSCLLVISNNIVHMKKKCWNLFIFISRHITGKIKNINKCKTFLLTRGYRVWGVLSESMKEHCAPLALKLHSKAPQH